MVAEQRVCKYTLSTPSVRPASMRQWGCSQQLLLQHTGWHTYLQLTAWHTYFLQSPLYTLIEAGCTQVDWNRFTSLYFSPSLHCQEEVPCKTTLMDVRSDRSDIAAA